MKKRINQYIPTALENIRSQLANPNQEVDARYDGYAASLGPAIITSGLKAALSFYTDLKRTEEGPRRLQILQIIESILQRDGVIIPRQQEPGASLLMLTLPLDEHSGQFKELKVQILDATVALKLAFRNFNQVKM